MATNCKTAGARNDAASDRVARADAAADVARPLHTMPPSSSAGCLFSWGGGDIARGWHGKSGGAGPSGRVSGVPSDVSLLAASRNSLAATTDGRIFSWGHNDSRGGGDAWFVRGGHTASISDSGQLGRSGSARAIGLISSGALGAEGASALASGRYHALAIGRNSHHVYSWGLNDHGQLGRSGWAERRRGGNSGPRECHHGGRCRDGTPLPVKLKSGGLLNAASIASGRYFSAAVQINTGNVYAWGRCGCGYGRAIDYAGAQVVEDELSEFNRPPQESDSDVMPATSEASNTGDGDGGGGGGRGRSSRFGGSTPYQIQGSGIEGEQVTSIAAGYTHLLMLTKASLLYSCECGDDGYGGRLKTSVQLDAFGQLGRPGPPLLPLRVRGPSFDEVKPILIAAGRCASFVVTSSSRGEVYSWGCGQGSGHAPPDRKSPELLNSMSGKGSVRLISAGEYHAVAAVEGGPILTWGSGAGSVTQPVEVKGLPRHSGREVVAVGAGYQHTLVSLSGGACAGGRAWEL